MWKCQSSIRCWDSNPWPSGHESPPITTRPGLPFTWSYNQPMYIRVILYLSPFLLLDDDVCKRPRVLGGKNKANNKNKWGEKPFIRKNRFTRFWKNIPTPNFNFPPTTTSSLICNIFFLKLFIIVCRRRVQNQCDQMARLFFIIWLLTTTQICPKLIKFGKVRLKFCQTQNKHSKVCLRFFKVCPSYEISSNL